MTPKLKTLSDFMDGEYTDVNTHEVVNPDLSTRTHMYVVPDDLRGGKMMKRNLKNRERWGIVSAAFYGAIGAIIGSLLAKRGW